MITVLGVGNPIMSDDALGLELLRRVSAELSGVEAADSLHWVDPRGIDTLQTHPDVTFIDGGTAGMENLTAVLDAENLLLLDALAGPGQPGDVHVIEGDQIPRLLQAKLSPHQVGLLDLLSAARLIGHEPKRVAVVGIVAADTQLNVGMTDVVVAALPQAARQAAELIQSWLSTST